jgi:hypothetical protein
MNKLAMYFGCLHDKGHFFWSPIDRVGRCRPPSDFHWSLDLVDGGLLKNRGVTALNKVIWLCGGRPVLWHAFLWWDRSVDQRPGSNSGFYVRGFRPTREDAPAAFALACQTWPDVVARQRPPLVLDMEDPVVAPRT